MSLPETVYAKDVKKRVKGATPETLKSLQERMGIRLGALAALVRMLELRVEELEGTEGTGSMEDDFQALSRAKESKDEASLRRLACMIYRRVVSYALMLHTMLKQQNAKSMPS